MTEPASPELATAPVEETSTVPNREVLTTGRLGGNEWRFVVWREFVPGYQLCFGVRVARDPIPPLCDFFDIPPEPFDIYVLELEGFPSVVAGPLAPSIATVTLRDANGAEFVGEIHSPRVLSGVPINLFLIRVPSLPVEGLIEFVDRSDEVVASEPILVEAPAESWPDGFLEDAYGNFFGVLEVWDDPTSCDPEATPGAPASPEQIRALLCTPFLHLLERPVVDVAQRWWADRPSVDAPAETLLEWWAKYPVNRPIPRLQ